MIPISTMGKTVLLPKFKWKKKLSINAIFTVQTYIYIYCMTPICDFNRGKVLTAYQ